MQQWVQAGLLPNPLYRVSWAVPGMVACPSRPSKVGRFVRSGQVESLYASQKLSWQDCAASFWPGGCACALCAATEQACGSGRSLFLACLWVGVSWCRVPVVVCTSPEASCALQPTGARSSELFLCVLSVAQPVERSVAHSVGPRGFCPSGPQLLCLSPLCLEQSVFACACAVDLGGVAAWTGGGRCSLRKRA